MGRDAGVGMDDKKTDGGHQIETLDTHGKMMGIGDKWQFGGCRQHPF